MRDLAQAKRDLERVCFLFVCLISSSPAAESRSFSEIRSFFGTLCFSEEKITD